MRLFTLALLTCVGIDFSNPLLPGAVRFDAEASVHALRAERARTDAPPVRAIPRPAAAVRPAALGVVVRPPAPGRVDGPRPVLLAGLARASIDPARGALASAEDH